MARISLTLASWTALETTNAAALEAEGAEGEAQLPHPGIELLIAERLPGAVELGTHDHGAVTEAVDGTEEEVVEGPWVGHGVLRWSGWTGPDQGWK